MKRNEIQQPNFRTFPKDDDLIIKVEDDGEHYVATVQNTRAGGIHPCLWVETFASTVRLL